MNTEVFKVGDAVRVTPNSKLSNGKNAAAWIYETKLFVRELKDENVVLAKQLTGPIAGTFREVDLVEWTDEPIVAEDFEPYVIRTIGDTVAYAGAGVQFRHIHKYEKNRLLTVIAEKDGFGKLKLDGWVDLSKVVKR